MSENIDITADYKDKKEVIGITTDFAEWLEAKRDKQANRPVSSTDDQVITDFQGLSYINRNVKIEGFMQGPVASYWGAEVAAKSRKLINPKEFVDYCNSTNNLIFLYDLNYFPNRPIYGVVNSETMEATFYDEPVIDTKMGQWKIRYGEILVDPSEAK